MFMVLALILLLRRKWHKAFETWSIEFIGILIQSDVVVAKLLNRTHHHYNYVSYYDIITYLSFAGTSPAQCYKTDVGLLSFCVRDQFNSL